MSSRRIEVSFTYGESYRIRVRGHELVVDQPVEAGGGDSGPTPVELFVASLVSCIAYYAGRYLDRHGLPRGELRAAADFEMADDGPARVTRVRIRVHVPTPLTGNRKEALRAVVQHCTVHNSLLRPPEVSIDVDVT
ncbi:OsmC family protein [Streptomyces gilvosporeus]|uniref:Osmotically inducible protein OsmC n=1 Tax=Streptomyces gilvosporeus TaxID=553510 RepID=A0A1V0TKC6_9ACTN|nr:OsmC family protein [Streptomyces gilvosporeus]ARF53397.1 osmotically inducible protein OsmC [Streptomyces gilvosporeus]